ncbi:DUF6191 domain-containing protein [Streptomyces phytophilus]|uniref:DUF6191 domain-containing protein n=1 Tax=Streptomyces phytophilus TaxID=722715 RepID=UPI0015F013CA|nr:DUF6191 domain-containing protein [Streptomyces phytophilus]
MNIVAELFAPSHAHARRARERMELVVDGVGTGDPHRGPIDLTSGKVVIALGEAAKPAEEPEDAIPEDAIPDDIPSDAIPADAAPADAAPPTAVPSQATPTPAGTPRP